MSYSVYFIDDTLDPGYVINQSLMNLRIPDRIYAQYRNKPKAVNWYAICRKLGGQIDGAAQAVRGMYDIDNNVGEQLDIIGRLVVVDRNFLGNTPLSPGLFAEPDGDEFGNTDAMFSETTVGTDSQMSDEFFRLVIRAKIVKNNSDATIESILDGITFLLPGADVVRVIDGEDMSFSIEFEGNITDLERWALLNAKLIPKPQGVRFNGFLDSYLPSEFGDVDAEFGDVDAEFYGYVGV